METLSLEELDSQPMEQFSGWLAEAVEAELPEPTAMVLTTIASDPADRPHARTVLLKSHNDAGFTFYTNRTSRKGRDLAANSRACVVFPWYGLGRQVIAEGAVIPLSTEESEPYFHSRPRGSQVGAWASRQSTVLSSRAVLDDRYAELLDRWPEGTEVPMPDFWGGYRLEPERMEFWQSRPSRLHDRFSYLRVNGEEGEVGGGWKIQRLSP
ncbi:MAG: pyridoxamine 5'-phosphate oxidase [Streptosporangiaceae bacterium]